MRTPAVSYYRDLIFTLVSKDLKVRYKSTILGYLWSILNPIAFAAAFCFAFGILMPSPEPDYPLFLTVALFPWQWFSNSVQAANTYFLSNASLIKKVRFPRAFLVLSGVLNDSVHFVISIPILVGLMLYYHRYPTLEWLWAVPAMLIIQLLVTLGICLIIATANLFFRDLERLTGILTMLWMYLTPVPYGLDLLQKHNLGIMAIINPMAPVIICWRDLFMGNPVQLPYMLLAWGWGVVLFVVGYFLYRAFESRFAEIV